MAMLLNFFSSLRLTLALLLGLAAVAVVGTVQPMADGRYGIFYQSVGFRFLLALLALNMAVCTLKTIRRNLRDVERAFETLRSEQVFGTPLRAVLPRNLPPGAAAAILRRRGYRVREDGPQLVARRAVAGRWGSTVVHLSVLAIMLGALAGEAGFVGTLNIYVGDESRTVFDWKAGSERPLGFTFRLNQFEPLYYPIDVQFAALDPATGRTLQTYTSREGETVDLPLAGLRARVVRFLPFEKQLVLGIYLQGNYLGEYIAAADRRAPGNSLDPGVELRPVAFRDPVLRQTRSEVAIVENGQVVKEGIIEVNHPLEHRGVTIYQTAFDRDKFGFWYAGYQFTRDPGEPVVWAGCVGLVLGLLLAFVLPCRTVGVTARGGEVLLVGLSGLRGEGGKQELDSLAADLSGA